MHDYKIIGLIDAIETAIIGCPLQSQAYEDMFSIIRTLHEEGEAVLAHQRNEWLRDRIAEAFRDEAPDSVLVELGGLNERSLLFDAQRGRFDPYMLYLELNRPAKERFYQPRRRQLKGIVDDIQKLLDGEISELFLSLMPRVGKTTLMQMLMTMIIGMDSGKSNLYSAFSDTVTNSMYEGVLEVINDPYTYRWQQIFPLAKVAHTNSSKTTVDIDRRKKIPSLTCRSLYGSLNGACDASGFLIADDLLSGIEQAMNPDQLKKVWELTNNNLITRAKETCRFLWVGTRWSLVDPIGKRIDMIENEPAFKDYGYRVINRPALDENDESNFDYDYGLGFSTQYLRRRRASFERTNDMASWLAQYQGEPIEREGALFTPDRMRYYNGVLPDEEPDRIFMAVDPAFGGGDFVAAPVVYKYGDDLFVHDVVYNPGDKRVTIPALAEMIERRDVQACQVEADKKTESYTEELESELAKRDMKINLTSKPAPNTSAKSIRIFDKAPDIMERMVFRQTGIRTAEYEQFMQNLFSFKLMGKNKTDDAPDSCSMIIDMDRNPAGAFKIFQRMI